MNPLYMHKSVWNTHSEEQRRELIEQRREIRLTDDTGLTRHLITIDDEGVVHHRKLQTYNMRGPQ